VKLDELRSSSPPKASCQQSFRLDLPHSGGISEDPAVSVSFRLALHLPGAHASAVSGRVWPGLSSREQVA
jgi:hypothetical protein